MSINSFCQSIPPPLRVMIAPCVGIGIGKALTPDSQDKRPSVPLPQSWYWWIAGAVILVVLFEYAPKIAGWILLALVAGFAFGPGSRFFVGGTPDR